MTTAVSAPAQPAVDYIAMPTGLVRKIAHFIELSTIVGEQAAKRAADQAALNDGVQKTAADATARLVEAGKVRPDAAAAVTKELADPKIAIQHVLKMALAAPAAEATPPRMGAAVPAPGAAPAARKVASANTGPSELDQANDRFASVLGLGPEFAQFRPGRLN